MALDWIALWIALVIAVIAFFLRGYLLKRPTPFLYYPEVASLKSMQKSWRVRFAHLPSLLKWMALAFLLAAFINPRIERTVTRPLTDNEKPVPTQGAAIYFLLDQSGSMGENIVMESDQVGFPTKMDELKKITKKFIQGDGATLGGRWNDLIGIVSFARAAHVLSPLTLDHDAINKLLDNLTVVSDPSQDGTSIGYAIYKTAHSIAATKEFASQVPANEKPAYEIKDTAMILVTDGFQSPNPEDKGKRLRNIGIEEAAAFAKEENIRLYIICIEPLINSEEFAPQRRQMQKSAEMTGGKFFPLADASKLLEIYQQIDRLQKSALPSEIVQNALITPKKKEWFYFYPYFLAVALLLTLAAVSLETTELRRAP